MRYKCIIFCSLHLNRWLQLLKNLFLSKKFYCSISGLLFTHHTLCMFLGRKVCVWQINFTFVLTILWRFSGIFLSSRLSPATNILNCLISCVLSNLLLVLSADKVVELLFLGTGAVGFFVSLQFASGRKWSLVFSVFHFFSFLLSVCY